MKLRRKVAGLHGRTFATRPSDYRSEPAVEVSLIVTRTWGGSLVTARGKLRPNAARELAKQLIEDAERAELL